MGQLNYDPVEPRGNKSVDEYLSYLANLYAMNQDELVSLLEGRLSSINIREIAGFLVDLLTLKHKSGLVGMSAADPNNPDAVRFWAGDADKDTAPFRVTQKGAMHAVDAFITGLITGSVIIGAEIKTSETEYPRVTISSTSKLIAAESSATESIEILADDAGQPAIHLDNSAVQAIIHANALAAALIINTVVGKGKIQISSGGDLDLFAESTAGKVKFDSWSKVQRITAPAQTLQQALDGKANAFTGFTGSFSTGTQTVTVNNGIITSVV